MTGTQVDKVDRGYVVGQGEAVLGDEPGVMATRISTAGSLTLIEQNVQGGPPWHVHSREDECFYVLGGLLTVRCGDDVFEARTHSFVFLPRGVPHTFEVVGDSARVLIIAVPGGLEEYFRELHQAWVPTEEDNGRVRRAALHAPGGSPKGSVHVSAVSLKADPVEEVFASDRRWRMQHASTHPPDSAFDGLSGREGPSEGGGRPPSDGHDCFWESDGDPRCYPGIPVLVSAPSPKLNT